MDAPRDSFVLTRRVLAASVGLLAALGVLARSPAERAEPWRSPAYRPAPELDPAAWPARRLRSLPGIGPSRALAIARERFERGLTGTADWDVVHGIGPATVERVQEALRRRAHLVDGSAPPYTRPEEPDP